MAKEKEAVLLPEEDEPEEAGTVRSLRHRRQRVEPTERDDYQEWVDERRDRGRKRRTKDERKRREPWEDEAG